jgi:hypothetical protein
MINKTIVLWVLISASIFLTTDIALAQFWRNWFQKDQQAEEPSLSKNDTEVNKKPAKQALKIQDIPDIKGEDALIDNTTLALGESKDSANQAAVTGEKRAQETAELPMQSAAEISEKEREEALQRTQEQVDQIKKIQEMNNIQRSLDNIKRINEMNQQRRSMDEINKLNRIQRNIDELRRLEEIRK